jgi:hypothetical protein
MSDIFFDEAEKDKAEAVENFAEQITGLTRKVQKLNDGANRDWTTSDEFRSLLKILGDLPSIKLLEDLVSHYKRTKNKILIKEIPDLMERAGVDSLTTLDGVAVKLKQDLTVKVHDKEALNQWLIDNGFGDKLKDIVTFPKGEVDGFFFKDLEEQGLSFTRDRSVHPQSLRALMRINLEEGELPPDEICEVKNFTLAKIK